MYMYNVLVVSQTSKHADRKMNWQTERLLNKRVQCSSSQTGKQTDKQTSTQTAVHTCIVFQQLQQQLSTAAVTTNTELSERHT